jgi:threonine aldolase
MDSFASDNTAGVHPEIMAALEKVNQGHCSAYGDDPYTRSAFSEPVCMTRRT